MFMLPKVCSLFFFHLILKYTFPWWVYLFPWDKLPPCAKNFKSVCFISLSQIPLCIGYLHVDIPWVPLIKHIQNIYLKNPHFMISHSLKQPTPQLQNSAVPPLFFIFHYPHSCSRQKLGSYLWFLLSTFFGHISSTLHSNLLIHSILFTPITLFSQPIFFQHTFSQNNDQIWSLYHSFT